MKIAILQFTLGITHRGSEAVTDLLSAELAKKHEVLVLQSGPVSKKPYQVKRVYPLSRAPLPAPRNILEKLLFRLKLDGESETVRRFTKAALPPLSSFQPDVVIPVNGSPQLKILREAQLSAKFVVFGHAGIGHHDNASIRLAPDLFIALSPKALSWAKTIAPAKTKVAYIPNPLDPRFTKKSQPPKLNLPHPLVLTVSALSGYKNVPIVVKAVAQTGASYLLIGDGEDSAQVSAAFSSFPGTFNWIKHVNPEDLPGYYAASDVFCFTPGPEEALGLVYLEAMAAGLPIVASGDQIRRTLIGPQGYFVNPHDLGSIRTGLTQALLSGKLKYTKELNPYQPQTVLTALEKELHALVK